jgi:flagellar biosynthesis protein
MSPYNNPPKAAALKYQPTSPHSAPVVVASGYGYTAQKIIDIAEENNVPVYEDDSLATILAQFHAGSEIPAELYKAIVDIYLYFLNYSTETTKSPMNSNSD